MTGMHSMCGSQVLDPCYFNPLCSNLDSQFALEGQQHEKESLKECEPTREENEVQELEESCDDAHRPSERLLQSKSALEVT